MSNVWIGYIVSIDCGEVLGSFQGKVSFVNEINQTISLTKPYRNGIECTLPEIIIRAQDILELKIIKQNESVELKESNVMEKLMEAINLEDIETNDKKNAQSNSDCRRKPGTPKARRKWQERDVACFSAPVDSYILENDFDFEKNLALFNKHAVFQEINTSKPDVVKTSDTRKTQNYRCDENIIEQEPLVLRQIIVPLAEKKEYVTDTGLIVPTIQPALREKLFITAEKYGLTSPRIVNMIGRAASEMIVHLLGGSHRLNPQNTHQRPLVVILCGAHLQGMQGIICGRHLANHGADVLLFLPNNLRMSASVSAELNLYKLTDGKHVTSVKDLPTDVVDIVVSAMDDHFPQSKDQLWIRAIANWVYQCRAPVLALDPPPEGSSIKTPKWSIVPALPLCLEGPGAVYLCDVGIPRKIFTEVGIRYSSPFGAKFLIPLHNKST